MCQTPPGARLLARDLFIHLQRPTIAFYPNILYIYTRLAYQTRIKSDIPKKEERQEIRKHKLFTHTRLHPYMDIKDNCLYIYV